MRLSEGALTRRTRSHDYWNERPDGFSKYYRRATSVGIFVSRFLHQRTDLILALVACTQEQSVLDVAADPAST